MEFSLPISFIQRKCKISSIADQEFFSHIQIHNIKNNSIMLMQIQILLFTLQRIQLWLFTLMQNRTQLPKIMQIHADADLEHWYQVYDITFRII